MVTLYTKLLVRPVTKLIDCPGNAPLPFTVTVIVPSEHLPCSAVVITGMVYCALQTLSGAVLMVTSEGHVSVGSKSVPVTLYESNVICSSSSPFVSTLSPLSRAV